MHKTVLLKDVIPPGYTSAQRTWDVKVFPRDAELEIVIVKNALSSLMGAPYNLEVLRADHSNCSITKASHGNEAGWHQLPSNWVIFCRD